MRRTIYDMKGSYIMFPVKLIPPVKDYIWGGEKLKTEYGIHTDLIKAAEAWVLSCHKDGQSIISGGEYDGRTLESIIEEQGESVLGRNAARFDFFPVLIKLIDAKDNLSVQVHPDNEYARVHEGEYGKTEAWYILDCEPGASLIYGFKCPISKDEFRERIENNTLLDVVNQVPVHPGDLFFIDSGTLHAIGKGILLAEVQQNSNTTYRVYDYGRLGADGKPRTLHINKALDVTRCEPPRHPVGPSGAPEHHPGYTSILQASCTFFTFRTLEIDGTAVFTADGSSFVSVVVLEGEGVLEFGEDNMPLRKGESVFVPADAGEYSLTGCFKVLETRL